MAFTSFSVHLTFRLRRGAPRAVLMLQIGFWRCLCRSGAEATTAPLAVLTCRQLAGALFPRFSSRKTYIAHSAVPV